MLKHKRTNFLLKSSGYEEVKEMFGLVEVQTKLSRTKSRERFKSPMAIADTER